MRFDELFCEMLDYNILFRWFLDLNLEEASFDPTIFTKNRERLLAHHVAQQFFDAVVGRARAAGLLSDAHFTVDGTLIKAWASLKSFKARTTDDATGPIQGPTIRGISPWTSMGSPARTPPIRARRMRRRG